MAAGPGGPAPFASMPSPLDRVRDVLGVGVDEIPGATVSTEIPIPDRVINRFIARALQQRPNAPVSAVRIETSDGDRFVAHVSIRKLPMIPEISVAAEVERQPQLPESPVLWLRWSLPHLGPIARIAAPIVSNLKGLPPGIRIDGERAAIDVAELLRARGLGDVVALVTRLEVGTMAGRVVVRLELRT